MDWITKLRCCLAGTTRPGRRLTSISMGGTWRRSCVPRFEGWKRTAVSLLLPPFKCTRLDGERRVHRSFALLRMTEASGLDWGDGDCKHFSYRGRSGAEAW